MPVGDQEVAQAIELVASDLAATLRWDRTQATAFAKQAASVDDGRERPAWRCATAKVEIAPLGALPGTTRSPPPPMGTGGTIVPPVRRAGVVALIR